MRPQIIHGGQTGVDRGGHIGAVDAGLTIAGYMPNDRRDERGPIPPEVAQHLVPHRWKGYPARTRANVDMCGAALIVVRDRQNPNETDGTAFTLREIRAMHRPPMTLIVDPQTEPAFVDAWVRDQVERMEGGQLRLLVAGPRASRWADGELVAANFVRSLGFIR